MRLCNFVFKPIYCVVFVASALVGQQQDKKPERDAQTIEILKRVVQAAGGPQSVIAVRDITEKGEITFYRGKVIKGPVIIQMFGGDHFRLEADVSDGKELWIVNDGVGSREKSGKTVPLRLSPENALNPGNLTYPLGHIAEALKDAKTGISLAGIETRDGRSIYRVRLKGRLGLSSNPVPNLPVAKDLLIDALNFGILSVEDRPFQTYEIGGRPSRRASRSIEYSDFRTVSGVLVPFSTSIRVLGQPTLSIHLTSVAFNSGLSPADFNK